jgi:hypothetical protein
MNYLGTNCSLLFLFSDLRGLSVFAGDIPSFLWLCRVRTFTVVIHRIKYQQRETLH